MEGPLSFELSKQIACGAGILTNIYWYLKHDQNVQYVADIFSWSRCQIHPKKLYITEYNR